MSWAAMDVSDWLLQLALAPALYKNKPLHMLTVLRESDLESRENG